jgi:hypothetical protein
MKYITIILLFIGFNSFGQFDTMLLASQQQVPVGNPEGYLVNNAIATGANEANGTTGLTSQGLTELVSISSTPSPQDGSFLVRFNTTTQPDRMEEDLTVVNGATYVIKYWAWSDIDAGGRSNLWTGVTASPSFYYTTTPTLYEHVLTTNSTTMLMRFYVMINSANVYIDGLSIKLQ